MTSGTQISRRDSEVLCSLATQVAEIAALPVQEEKRRLWKQLNSLKPVRPLVHICQEPWREIEGTEYILETEGDLARQLESQLRRRLWRWKNAPADDPVEAVVLDVDKGARRLSLGLRQTEPNPWQTISDRYHEGDRITGKVRNLTDFGAFIEVEDGIDGLVHISDMSWTPAHDYSALAGVL